MTSDPVSSPKQAFSDLRDVIDQRLDDLQNDLADAVQQERYQHAQELAKWAQELADLRGTFNALRDKEQTPESIGADDPTETSSTVEDVLKAATTAESEQSDALASATTAAERNGSVPNDRAPGRASSPPSRGPTRCSCRSR